MNKLKTAVIGVGNLGQHHARWYNTIRESELVGVYDVDRDRCQKIAEGLGVTPFTSLSDVFGLIDVASVVVPTIKHFEVAEQLIKNNIHCLIEKPVAASYEQAEQLIKLAEEKDVILSVGHIERFNPAVQALKKYEINPRFIEAHRLAVFNPGRGTDVAVILDLMTHDIELSVHLIKSRIARIEASAVQTDEKAESLPEVRLLFIRPG
jgi:predicted dehydrogenase